MDEIKKLNNPNKMIQQQLNRSMFTLNRSNSLPTLPANNDSDAQTEDTKSTCDKENSSVPWQKDKVPPKRQKRKETSPIHRSNTKKSKNATTFAVPTHNTFDILNSEEIEETAAGTEYVPKPEPIFVTGVMDVTALKATINKIVDNKSYIMTTLRSGHIIKLMPNDINTYKVIREQFIANNISHYTYKLKSERAYRVVLRGLHATEDTSLIKAELKEQGHEVRQIVNVLHRTTKEALPIFFVDLEPNRNNKEIFKLRYLSQMKVSFEAPYKKTEIMQCKRCQRFGHTKNQCFRPFRCVKCGNDHPTTQCTKTPDTDATCANCQEKHPASYKGCTKYKQYREKILKVKPKTNENPTLHAKEIKILQETSNPNQKETNDNDKRSYADVTRQQTKLQNIPDVEKSPDRLELMFAKFQQIMINMMDKMMDRMIQLVSSLVTK